MKLTDVQQPSLLTMFGQDRVYEIPEFQRNYSWTQSEIRDLWNDIMSVYQGSSGNHFLGPIVLLDAQTSQTIGGQVRRYSVIDGQQRLTSLYLLLAAIRNMFLERLPDAKIVQAGMEVNPLHRIAVSLLQSDFVSPTLKPNYQVANAFTRFVVATPTSMVHLDARLSTDVKKLVAPERRRAKLLLENFRYMQVLLGAFLDDDGASTSQESPEWRMWKLLDVVLCRLEFLQMVVPTEEDAYVLFETLNDRGLRLSPSDLLKSFLVRTAVSESTIESRDEVISKWDQSVDLVQGFDFTRFLRHLIVSETQSKTTRQRLFADYRKLVAELSAPGVSGALSTLARINEAAHWYSTLLAPKADAFDFEGPLFRLNQIGESHRIFMLAMRKFSLDPAELKRCASVLENFAFRWVMCGQNAQVLEDSYCEALAAIEADASHCIDSGLKILLAKAPSDESLRIAFRQEASSKLRNYVLRRYSLAAFDVVSPETSVLHIEHIAPRNPDEKSAYWYEAVAPAAATVDGGFEQPTYEDYVECWGNLTLLDQRINSTIRNGSWLAKVGRSDVAPTPNYMSSTLAMTTGLLHVEDWTKDVIDARTSWFADHAAKLWPISLTPEFPKIDPFVWDGVTLPSGRTPLLLS